METARFQIVSGVRTGHLLQPPWPVVDLAHPPEQDVDPGRWFAWRLLSRNHRDLARSPAVYATPQECRAAVARLRAGAADAGTELSRNQVTGRWTWVLRATDGAALATGSRGYLRRRECHDCVAQVVGLAAVALDPSPEVAHKTVTDSPVRSI